MVDGTQDGSHEDSAGQAAQQYGSRSSQLQPAGPTRNGVMGGIDLLGHGAMVGVATEDS